MFNHISHDKVEELVRLAERAAATPHDDASQRRAPGQHNPPLRPQPAADWQAALPRYLEALPDAALEELVALYCAASDGASTMGPLEQPTGTGAEAGRPDRIAFLLSRADLARVLRSAYMQR